MIRETLELQTTSIRQAWWRGLSTDQWSVFAAASLAWLFDCFDQQVFNLTREGALEDLISNATFTTRYSAYATSVFLVAWAVGGMILGALGDRYGRARMLTISILLYALSTGLSALSTGIGDFLLYRFLSGIGIGGVFGLAVALVADALPDRSRASALGLLQALSTWGNMAAALLGMTLGTLAARQSLPFGLKQWQALSLIGAFPALLSVFLLRRLAEPPKWILAQSEGVRRGIKFGSYRHLLSHANWSRHAWLGLIACSAGIIGLWGIGNFHPKIVGALVEQSLSAAGVSAERLSGERAYWRAAGLLLQNIGGFFGMLALAKIAQVSGRRIAFSLALLLSWLTTILVFRYLREIHQMYWMLPLMGFGQLSVFGVYAVYLPELFPTSLRSTGTSFCYNVGRIAAATTPFIISQITESLGGDIEGFRTAGLWASFTLLAGIAIVPFLPETKDQPLPED